jgi:hypothetical protein
MAVAQNTTRESKVNTAKASGRRSVRYNSIEDLLADAERLAKSPHRTIGNWSLGMILKHISDAYKMGLDGAAFMAPWPLRWYLRTFMKQRFLQGPMPAGFKLPKRAASLLPSETSPADGLAALQKVTSRWKSESQRAIHPALGNLTPAEWDQLELRHAELHMSFVLPESTG